VVIVVVLWFFFGSATITNKNNYNTVTLAFQRSKSDFIVLAHYITVYAAINIFIIILIMLY